MKTIWSSHHARLAQCVCVSPVFLQVGFITRKSVVRSFEAFFFSAAAVPLPLKLFCRIS